MFLGTCVANDVHAALLICKANLLQCVIELLKAKQEDDEMVLQVRHFVVLKQSLLTKYVLVFLEFLRLL